MLLWNVKVNNSDLIASAKIQIKCKSLRKQVSSAISQLQIDQLNRSGRIVSVCQKNIDRKRKNEEERKKCG